MTWLSFCARRPGPEWKTGYGTGDRTLAQIEGVVDHSMEGPLRAAYGVLDGPEQSSWTFSIPKVGEPVQHYSLKKIPWHAGLPGDRRHDTSLIGNLRNTWSTYLDPTKNPPEERPYGSKALINACKEHKYLKTFAKRTALRKEVYEEIVEKWGDLNLPDKPPVITAFEKD